MEVEGLQTAEQILVVDVRLDWMVSEVFSNLNGSMILRAETGLGLRTW